MGFYKHHVIIVTDGIPSDNFLNAYMRANLLFPGLVTQKIESKINSFSTFFISPDGSKDGWKESDMYDQKRKEFLNWIDKMEDPPDYVELSYSFESEEEIVRTNSNRHNK